MACKPIILSLLHRGYLLMDLGAVLWTGDISIDSAQPQEAGPVRTFDHLRAVDTNWVQD